MDFWHNNTELSFRRLRIPFSNCIARHRWIRSLLVTTESSLELDCWVELDLQLTISFWALISFPDAYLRHQNWFVSVCSLVFQSLCEGTPHLVDSNQCILLWFCSKRALLSLTLLTVVSRNFLDELPHHLLSLLVIVLKPKIWKICWVEGCFDKCFLYFSFVHN